MRIDASGNVGIGTSSPAQKLSVTVADGAQAVQLRGANGMVRVRPYQDATNGAIIDSANIAENAYFPLTLTGSTLRLFGNNATGITVDASGNVGIGDTTPSTKLDVAGVTSSVFYENPTTITTSYTITTGSNAMAAGPITIASGVTVTIPSGSVWTIV